MPSTSAKQARFMSALSHGWTPPEGVHAPPLSVAREFHAADKKEGKYMHAEGGKISGLRAALDALLGRLPEAPVNRAKQYAVVKPSGQIYGAPFDLKVSADHIAGNLNKQLPGHVVQEVPSDLSPLDKYTPSTAQDLGPQEVDQLMAQSGGGTYTGKARGGRAHFADGGAVENDAPKTDHILSLISHAADRATATVTDDPHHALARVASGLASQVVGQSPSGNPQLGRKPNLINEIQSLPAAGVDIGVAGSNVLGALSDKYLPHVPGSVGDLLSRLRDHTSAYLDKHGDPAPAWARDAETRANEVHHDVDQSMGLGAPKGFSENAADSLGQMLGQVPIPFGEAKTAARGVKGGLSALLRAVPEYLGPTVRPSVRNYATGALGGGALNNLASMGDNIPPPQVTDAGGPMKEKFE